MQLPEMYTDDQTKDTSTWKFCMGSAIRFHNNEYYIYWGDPDHGIYVSKPQPLRPMDETHLVQEAKGWIDPCPLWDDNGKPILYMLLAGSRAGIKSVLVINEMSFRWTLVKQTATWFSMETNGTQPLKV
jgi:hypothetical protein